MTIQHDSTANQGLLGLVLIAVCFGTVTYALISVFSAIGRLAVHLLGDWLTNFNLVGTRSRLFGHRDYSCLTLRILLCNSHNLATEPIQKGDLQT